MVLPTQPVLPPLGAPLGRTVETLVDAEATAMLRDTAPPLQKDHIRQWCYNRVDHLFLLRAYSA